MLSLNKYIVIASKTDEIVKDSSTIILHFGGDSIETSHVILNFKYRYIETSSNTPRFGDDSIETSSLIPHLGDDSIETSCVTNHFELRQYRNLLPHLSFWL